MALWMHASFRTALPSEPGSNVLEFKSFMLKFKINNAKELHDTTIPTWTKRVQEVLHQWEGRPENWPVRVYGLEIVEKEDEEQ